MVNWESEADRGNRPPNRGRGQRGQKDTTHATPMEKTPPHDPPLAPTAPRGSPIAKRLAKNAPQS